MFFFVFFFCVFFFLVALGNRSTTIHKHNTSICLGKWSKPVEWRIRNWHLRGKQISETQRKKGKKDWWVRKKRLARKEGRWAGPRCCSMPGHAIANAKCKGGCQTDNLRSEPYLHLQHSCRAAAASSDALKSPGGHARKGDQFNRPDWMDSTPWPPFLFCTFHTNTGRSSPP